MSVTIRTASQADTEDMARIEKDSFSMPWSQKAFDDAVKSPNYIYMAALEKCRVVGYAGCTVLGDEGDITNIAVDNAYRGRGIGKALLDGLLDKAYSAGVHQIFLEVRESNAVAQSLYTQSGFERIGTRRNFYQKPTEDAILMKWTKI